MTARKIPPWSLLVLALLAFGSPALAQPTKLPTADEVKALQATYRAEHDKVVKAGFAKRFIPAIMDKAEELAKKSDAALASGRLLQASEAIRQARWQLPYQPVSVPDHVSRIIGNLRLRHMRAINAVAFSPDGLKLASASNDKTVKIWDLGNGHELLTYTGHTDDVRCLAWSLDGKTIISAGQEKNIKIWDAQTGKDVRTITATGEKVRSLLLSRDGKHVITGQMEVPGNPPNGIFVYETATGKLVREVRDFANKIDALALNTEGSILAAGDDNGNTRLFQYPVFVDDVSKPAYWEQGDPTGPTYRLAFSPDGKTLARVGPRQVKIYATVQPGAPFQVAEPRPIINTLTSPNDNIGALCARYSPNGKTILIGGVDGTIRFFDPADGQKLSEFKSAHTGALNDLAFTPDGNRMASCSGDFIIRLWDFNVVLQSRDFEGHDAPVWTAAFSPDGTRIVSASADKTVRVWQRDTGKGLFTIGDHTAPVTVAQFSPDGKLIASAGGDKIIRIFDADTGKPLRVCAGHQATITFLDFSADSKRIVSGSADRRIKIWDADKGTELVSINDNPSIVAGVAFNPNGKQIAVANVDQTIRLYDDKGKLQNSWNAHGGAVNGVAYSPNGQYLASCGVDMAVQVWPLATPGTNNMRLDGHAGPVSSVAFRKDNQHLVSCGADQTIRLWKIEGNSGKEVQTFKGHKDWVTSVAFSKDGYHVISASVDRRLKIWEITSRELPLLAEHSSAVNCVAVSPDGKYIATGSADRAIKIWDLKTGFEVATLTGHQGAVMSLAFTPDSKRIVSSGKSGVLGDYTGRIHLWEINPPSEIPRNQLQMNVFGKLRRYSTYISVEPTGKDVYVWQPIREARVSTVVEAFGIDTGAPVWEFMEVNRKVNSLAFCADGKLAAAGGEDGSVRIWDLTKAKPESIPGGDWFLFDKVGVADLALTPDGSTLIATSEKGEIKIGTLQGRKILKSFQGHPGIITACMISPDGKRFATVGEDNILKAWDMNGKELRRWDLGKGQDMFLIGFVFTPDSRQIVTANANTTVYVLDLP